jgi:hypothetical protein
MDLFFLIFLFKRNTPEGRLWLAQDVVGYAGYLLSILLLILMLIAIALLNNTATLNELANAVGNAIATSRLGPGLFMFFVAWALAWQSLLTCYLAYDYYKQNGGTITWKLWNKTELHALYKGVKDKCSTILPPSSQ